MSDRTREVITDNLLDIRAETCPMTFVRTRLALDRLEKGQILCVWLQGDEPTRNVPKTAIEQGHAMLHRTDCADGSMKIWFRKGG